MNYAKEANKLLLAMNEKGQKAVYEFIMLFNSWKQEKGEDRTATPTIKTPDLRVYEQNDTMRMISKQNILPYIDDEEIMTALRNITQVRGYKLKGEFLVFVLDVFIYGSIIGKREERAKKKATNPTTKQGKQLF